MMRTVVVESIDHRERGMAARIHAIQVAAYTQEATLLGAISFPPLQRAVADIETSTEHFFAAYLDGAFVGVIALERKQVDNATHISSLVVLPAFQRLGVGRALLSAVVSESPTEVLTVSTGLHNTPALALYGQFGFVEHSRRLVGIEKLPVVKQTER
jgi:ribosomal protein S18 acetylase RimI-like enzyme